MICYRNIITGQIEGYLGFRYLKDEDVRQKKKSKSNDSTADRYHRRRGTNDDL